MILVEGPDNSGKTCLVETLAKTLRLPIIKSYRPQSTEDILQLHCWAMTAPRTAIMDRHAAISDWVYGHILRNHTPSSSRLISHLLDTPEVFTILCDPGLSVIRSTYQDRPQLEGTEENLSAIHQRYYEVPLTYDYFFNYTKPNALPSLLKHLTIFLSRTAE